MSRICVALLAGAVCAFPVFPALAAGAVHPRLIDKADLGGAIFEKPDTITKTRNGNTIRDHGVLTTKDTKFEAGMYTSGSQHFEAKGDKTFGVNQLSYLLKGSFTLTSLDGHVTTVHAGEAVVIPSDWQGTWDSKGYTELYAVYSPKGHVDED